MTMLMVLNWLKSLLMAAAQAAMGFLGWLANLAIGAWNGAMGFLGMVGSFFTSAGAAVGSALGVSAVAGTMSLVGVIVAGGLVAGGGLAASLTSQVTQQTDQVATSCILNAQQAAAVSNADPNGANATQLKNAQTLYSVLSAWGMPKENIAGILGNWEAESGIDPTSVQNNSAPVFQMSDAKKAAAGNTANGIGLGQWTAGRNTSLRNFATGAGKDWWTIETQLSYMMSPAEGANADVIRDMIKTSKGSPGAAALYFHQKWERSADDASQVQRRSDFADKWFALMSGWSSDKSLADSVLKQAGATLNAANQNQVAAAKSGCQSLNTTNVVLKDGGQDQADAQKLIDLYNSEGDAFLDGRYGQNGGPGSCGDNHAENCVSFSTYFLNKYTTFQQYPAGDGIDIASVVANATGKKLSSTPTAYAVGSGPGTSSSGHTLVVLGVKGNSVIVGEANFCQTMGRVRVTTVQELQSAGWKFVDMSDSMLPKDKVKTS
ncbi:phage tail tip lysozyme [Arthrobacter bambusae]|uniref:Phage tail lysozyme domain-containing protein n=1 Tax=Arthrobacter bambusae TaxID=1338426 RepID=A0AAW8DD39_9MICC|nr:phage tail tip lysozyme [Arthrobacter bambusae]MDP9903205.1 hypothetical protein [Arthrobacter bambusae]MDQ0128801.1 hypothetical protein [Arthrobacter bambusae]MDQ0180142.1 hypothetical protein [Arthrobacter bambusae]